MGKVKLALALYRRLKSLLSQKNYPNRSCAIEDAVEEKLNLNERSRLARECAKLDPDFEKAMAEDRIV